MAQVPAVPAVPVVPVYGVDYLLLETINFLDSIRIDNNPKYKKIKISKNINFTNNDFNKFYIVNKDTSLKYKFFNLSYCLNNGINNRYFMAIISVFEDDRKNKFIMYYDKLKKIISIKDYKEQIQRRQILSTSSRSACVYKSVVIKKRVFMLHQIKYFKYNEPIFNNIRLYIDTYSDFNLVIDHIDDISRNNKKNNLQLLTIFQNKEKSPRRRRNNNN